MRHNSKKVAVHDAKLFTRVLGQGYPIVLMHGGPGADHSIMLPLLPLSATNTVIYYDHRCNGRSIGPAVTSMTWENLTADADALREILGFEKWVVLGHSFGGMVALEYALRYPQRVSHLILADTCADITWAQQNAPTVLAARGYPKVSVESARRFFNGQIKPYELIPCMLWFGTAYTYTFNIWQSLSLLKIRARPDALIFGFGSLLKSWSVMNRLPELTMPTLVMAGRDDFLFPPEHQKQIVAGIPDAQLKIMENAGHNAPMEHPRQAIEVILKFIS